MKDNRFNLSDKVIERIIANTTENLTGQKSGVVSVRLSESEIELIDHLVLIGVFKSRSEATATLIREGIKAHKAVFEEVTKFSEGLNQLKKDIQDKISTGMSLETDEEEGKDR